jgi:predicted nucleotide-binding protein
MNEIIAAFAKLSGVQTAVHRLLKASEYEVFDHDEVDKYFGQANRQFAVLSGLMPLIYEDFLGVSSIPKRISGTDRYFLRTQLEDLSRTIEQAFDIRANSELSQPKAVEPERIASEQRIFITHGRANDWRELQSFIERDVGIKTLELAQQPNLGRTVLEKLSVESSKCTSAVIVMTGDDTDASGIVRARENVLHEIGYCQAKFGLSAVCLLHEEGTNIPSNIHGLVYIPFTKDVINMTFGPLLRELKAFYKL